MKRMRNWIVAAGREELLFFTASLGLFASLLLTQPAWTTDRTYPLSPIIPNLSLPDEIQLGLFLIGVIALLASTLTHKLRTTLLTISLASIIVLVLLDITRLQPWILHYCGILALFLFCIPRTEKRSVFLLDAARIIVSGIYFWSGIQKINERFFLEVFPWFTQPIWNIDSALLLPICIIIGIFVPFIEAAFALGFFTKKFRTVSILGSVAMIILVLISLGPLGNNWNSSVWPWNVGIFAMVLILFFRADFTLKTFLLRQKTNILGLFCFALFWILPAGNFIGITDHYLSWSLYSGRVPEAVLHADALYLDSLTPVRTEQSNLPFVDWTMEDMNIVPYPEERVFRSVFAQICKSAPEANPQLEIIIPHFWNSMEKDTLSYTCADI